MILALASVAWVFHRTQIHHRVFGKQSAARATSAIPALSIAWVDGSGTAVSSVKLVICAPSEYFSFVVHPRRGTHEDPFIDDIGLGPELHVEVVLAVIEREAADGLAAHIDDVELPMMPTAAPTRLISKS
ncbi:hypothetical protein F2P45_11170 [Massilia sp. CCM 8733]|uniref:Secreted protein n=1 Tax=Massilia mucilaginosa TaxID=2609282 RepID=A0ABX0NS39_9BURK|nr:hypothetical protein [Massilia mucilaginosa]NHZ89570.1 hypothetical protein [Massilia mucilaginosa]